MLGRAFCGEENFPAEIYRKEMGPQLCIVVKTFASMGSIPGMGTGSQLNSCLQSGDPDVVKFSLRCTLKGQCHEIFDLNLFCLKHAI